jgi:hypothetical protein
LRDKLGALSNMERLQLCGKRRAMEGRDEAGRPITATPSVRLSAETGLAHWTGIQRCGSVWICPACSAKIRRRRNEEVRQVCTGHRATGGGILFGTHTLRHRISDPFKRTVDGASNAWRSVQSNSAYKRFRKLYPHRFVRSLETPYGKNGWHPHLHLLCLTETVWTDDVVASFGAIVEAAWISAAKRLTGRAPSHEHAAQWERAYSDQDAADYLCKLQEGGRQWDAAAELTLWDLKRGRVTGSLHPYDIGATAANGSAWALKLWHEYEQGTHRKQAITFGTGIRADFLAEPDLTDEQIAERDEQEVAETIGYAVGPDWVALRRQKMLLSMLRAVELDGLDGFWRVLTVARARDAAWQRRRARGRPEWVQYGRAQSP